jgi:hypothetical protein
MASSPTIRAWAALVLALPLVACSGTPFGERLSESFSQQPAGQIPAAGPPGQPSPATAGTPATAGAPASTPTTAQPATPATPAAPRPPAQSAAPYRLILSLPAADPAAPAEAVTEALRAAGVSFEVETIERIPAASAAARPVPTPAPAASAPLAPPTTQPAPAPR